MEDEQCICKFDPKELSDFTVRIKAHKFGLHKVDLSRSCGFFQNFFQATDTRSNDSIAFDETFEPSNFKSFCNCIYNVGHEITNDDVFELAYLANYFDCKKVTEKVILYFKDTLHMLSPSAPGFFNILYMGFRVSDVHKIKELKECCMKFFHCSPSVIRQWDLKKLGTCFSGELLEEMILFLLSSAGSPTHKTVEYLDAYDQTGKWCPAQVMERKEGRVLIHYLGWPTKWDEWVDFQSDRLRVQQSRASEEEWKKRNMEIQK